MLLSEEEVILGQEAVGLGEGGNGVEIVGQTWGLGAPDLGDRVFP